MTQPSALDSFIGVTTEIEALLVELNNMAADHWGAEPDRVDWGHVGSAQRVKALLEQALSFAQGKGD